MATSKRQKRILIRFELGLLGTFSLALVSFCVLVWLFFLGIWAGQTIFDPEKEDRGALAKFTASLHRTAPPSPPPSEEVNAPARSEESHSPALPEPSPSPAGKTPALTGSDSSYFSLQVGAFQDSTLAEKAAEEWRGRGYEPFLQTSGEGEEDNFTRVFIGRFEKLADANELAERLEEKEKVKAYIALLPAAKN